MAEECEHEQISWDDKPDYEGCHGMCIIWFGSCESCGKRMRELWEPAGIEECEA